MSGMSGFSTSFRKPSGRTPKATPNQLVVRVLRAKNLPPSNERNSWCDALLPASTLRPSLSAVCYR